MEGNGDPAGTGQPGRASGVGPAHRLLDGSVEDAYCASPGSGRSSAARARACRAFASAPVPAAVFPPPGSPPGHLPLGGAPAAPTKSRPTRGAAAAAEETGPASVVASGSPLASARAPAG